MVAHHSLEQLKAGEAAEKGCSVMIRLREAQAREEQRQEAAWASKLLG